MGESGAKVARLFARAREGAPSVVFTDEIDSLVAASGEWGSPGVLSQLVVEIDMLPGQAWVLVVGATNRPDLLDPALVWRLSRTLRIGLPDAPARRRLFELLTRRMPLEGINLDQLAERTEGLSGADHAALCQQAAVVAMTRTALKTGERRETVTTTDFETALATLQSEQSLGRRLQN